MPKNEKEIAKQLKETIAAKRMEDGYKALFYAFIDEYVALEEANESISEQYASLSKKLRAKQQSLYENNLLEERVSNNELRKVIDLTAEVSKLKETITFNEALRDKIFDILLKNIQDFDIKGR